MLLCVNTHANVTLALASRESCSWAKVNLGMTKSMLDLWKMSQFWQWSLYRIILCHTFWRKQQHNYCSNSWIWEKERSVVSITASKCSQVFICEHSREYKQQVMMNTALSAVTISILSRITLCSLPLSGVWRMNVALSTTKKKKRKKETQTSVSF